MAGTNTAKYLAKHGARSIADDFIAEMEFPADLTERLRRWNAEYNEQPTGEPPHSQGPPREWFVDFEARGRVLADEVAAFLGPDYLVEYR